MLDALFLSTYTLTLLFMLIKRTVPLIFHIVVSEICEVSQERSTVTTSGTCYITRDTLLQERTRGSQSKSHSYMLLSLH